MYIITKTKIVKARRAFTIVELLVVIIVLAILAALTIVSFSGITSKARAASLQADLSSNSKKLKAYQAEYGSYPTALDVNNCPSAPTATSNPLYCVKTSSGNSVSSYVGSTSTFSLTITQSSSNLAYKITESSSATQVAALQSVGAGQFFSCALKSNGQVYCWGGNGNGQLGDGTYNNSSVPVAVNTSGALSGKTVKSMSVGSLMVCVIASDDKPYCWGNTFGSSPVAIDTTGVLSGKTVKQIGASSFHACAIASDDKVYCWGYGSQGKLGNGGTANSSSPVAVDTSGALSGKNILSLSVGTHTCVIASDNQGYCWGYNGTAGLGNNSTTDSLVPVAVFNTGALSGKTLKTIAAGNGTTCAVASDNQAYCWGSNGGGQTGTTCCSTVLVPTAVNNSGVLSGKTVKSAIPGNGHTCVLASDDKLYCMGTNSFGEYGNGTTTQTFVPSASANAGSLSSKTILSYSLGSSHMCTVASDGNGYCMGNGMNGALGDGTTNSSSIPLLVNLP